MVLGWVHGVPSPVYRSWDRKIPKSSKQQVLDWIVIAWRELQERPELIRQSFKVCGISNNLDGSEDKYVRCDNYISEDLKVQSREAYQEEDFEENPFEPPGLLRILGWFVLSVLVYIEPATCKNVYTVQIIIKNSVLPVRTD